jgi:hypothetical protein
MTVIERGAAPGVHRIDNAYLNSHTIEDGRELTLVDSGLPRSWRALERLLQLLGGRCQRWYLRMPTLITWASSAVLPGEGFRC